MKKIIFGIFAHPDDEAFGPAGTLLLETRAGTELHLITLTSGQAGTNPDNHSDLGAVRHQEWQQAGALLGATSMHDLGFMDGQLCNITLITAAEKISDIVTRIIDTHDNEIEIEFMTIDTNGITGHIDHIVAARAACLAFYRLKAQDSRYYRVRLACLPKSQLPAVNTDWLYMEPGHPESEIDETIDARHLNDDIIAVIRAHHSQRSDGDTTINQRGQDLGLNHFMIRD